ncbi:hypothetical protein I5168_07685 [Nonlabens sp. SCSIO 43208]
MPSHKKYAVDENLYYIYFLEIWDLLLDDQDLPAWLREELNKPVSNFS